MRNEYALASEFNTFPSRLFRDYDEYYIEVPDKMKDEIGQDEIRIRSGFKGIMPGEFFKMLAHMRLEKEEMDNKSKGSGNAPKPNKNPAF